MSEAEICCSTTVGTIEEGMVEEGMTEKGTIDSGMGPWGPLRRYLLCNKQQPPLVISWRKRRAFSHLRSFTLGMDNNMTLSRAHHGFRIRCSRKCASRAPKSALGNASRLSERA